MFGGVFRLVFTWLIPVILVANSPARILARANVHPVGLLCQLFVASAVAVSLSRWFWSFALRRYASASS